MWYFIGVATRYKLPTTQGDTMTMDQKLTACHLIGETDCFESLMQDLREQWMRRPRRLLEEPLSPNELVLNYAYDCGLDLFMPANLGLLMQRSGNEPWSKQDIRAMWQHGANRRVSEMAASI